MDNFVQEIVNSMHKEKTGKTVGEVRWYFENAATSFLFLTNPEKVITSVSADSLYLFRIFDELVKRMGHEDPYTFTPDMTYYGALENGDQVLIVTMPEPEEIGQAYAMMMFADLYTDYPGYFLVELGANDEMYLVAWDHKTNFYNFGTLEEPENAVEMAYNIYTKSKPATE